MNRAIADLVSKSERGLKAARHHVSVGDYDFAVSRAYYAMFHVTAALLLTKNLTSSKHSGLLSLFSAHFIQTGLIPHSFHRDIHRAFDLRQDGDYGADGPVSRTIAETLCDNAEAFVAELKKHIG